MLCSDYNRNSAKSGEIEKCIVFCKLLLEMKKKDQKKKVGKLPLLCLKPPKILCYVGGRGINQLHLAQLVGPSSCCIVKLGGFQLLVFFCLFCFVF